ncbi:hypothetical protein [Azotobacter chroococcum]|uniref:hypothetical protein n=1 Tax=Azotobacter chroococcum TaxID=353 RepID=UPI001186535E|nr:hypothetical protein [Azotobacter chroococcum]
MNKQHVQQPMSFSQSELDARKSKALDSYLNGHYKSYRFTGGSFVHPAMQEFTFNSIEDLVDHSQAMQLQGRSRYPHYISLQGIGFYSVGYYKSNEDQAADLVLIYEQVEADYRAEIDEHNEAQIELLTQQLLQQEKKKKMKKEEDENNRLLASAAKEAEEYFNSLITKEPK